MLIVVLINILILTGLGVLVLPNLVSLFICSGIAMVCGIVILYSLVNGTYGLRFTWLLASSLLIGYCGGCFSPILLAGFSDLYDAFSVFGIPKGWGAYALMLVIFSCITLLVVGFFESPVLKGIQIIRVGWKQERFLWVSLAITAIAFIHGDLGFQGSASESGSGKASTLGQIVPYLIHVLLPLALMGYLQTTGLRRKRFIFLSVACFVALLPSGRREIGYMMFLCVYAAFRFSGWTPRMNRVQKVLLGVGFVTALVFSALFFYALRLASREAIRNGQGAASTSITTIIPVLISDILTDPGYVLRETKSNLEERPFLLMEYLSLLGKGGNTPEPMYGQDFNHAVEMAIPDPVYNILGANKQKIRDIGTEEGVANEHFGIPDPDDANSLLSAGIIDFGLVGVLLYPLTTCFITRAMCSLVDQFFNREGQIVAALLGIFMFLQAEREISDYVLNIRNMVIVMIFWRALYELPTFFRVPASNIGGSEDQSFSTQ
jgi:hypothetical protein